MSDEAKQPVAVQLSDLELWPDKSVHKATVSFMVTLTPGQQKRWTLLAGRRLSKTVAGDLKVTEDQKAGMLQLENGLTGVRLVGGKATFAQPVESEKIPAPIQGVRLPGNHWLGKGWWQTDVKCTGYSAEVTDNGPVFARVKLHYDFEGGKYYNATIELNAGQDLAVVTEEFNLSDGTRYSMSSPYGGGFKTDAKYAYVYPKFASPDQSLIWDRRGQTHALLPTPNQYVFSFGKDLQPDRVEFRGYNKFGNIDTAGADGTESGSGVLKYDKDGRFAYVNAYPQWGDEETLYLGLYNSNNPSAMLGVVGLRTQPVAASRISTRIRMPHCSNIRRPTASPSSVAQPVMSFSARRPAWASASTASAAWSAHSASILSPRAAGRD